MFLYLNCIYIPYKVPPSSKFAASKFSSSLPTCLFLIANTPYPNLPRLCALNEKCNFNYAHKNKVLQQQSQLESQQQELHVLVRLVTMFKIIFKH